MTGKSKSGQKGQLGTRKADIPDEQGRHFSSIHIENFRCFKDFSIGSLNRVNLIGGKNNVGKTALLESIYLLLGATNASLILRINAFRGVESFEGDAATVSNTLWGTLFNNFDNHALITIKGELSTGKQISLTLKQTVGASTTLPLDTSPQGKGSIADIGMPAQALKLHYTNVDGVQNVAIMQIDSSGINIPSLFIEPLFPGIFLSARRRPSSQENTARYGQLELTDSHYDLIPALKIIEPRLKRISTLVIGKSPMLYADIGLGRMLPLAALGDGLGGLASLLLAISSAPGGVVLIDEIENGLHYSILVKVWQAVAEAARLYNTQVFATTHSWECIRAAHEAFKETKTYDFCYHRLQEVDGTIEAVAIDQNALETTIDSGWEIR